MRQAGILAAAGIVALQHMVERLPEDHLHCKQLALGLAEIPLVHIHPEHVVSNILIFSLQGEDNTPLPAARTDEFLTRTKDQGLLLGLIGPGQIRAVTHYGIESTHISTALDIIRRTLHEMRI